MVMKSFSSIYQLVVKIRHNLYSKQIKLSKKLSVPVVVVGNITAGGTGKTPVVDYILNLLEKKGKKAGVISRGYKGSYSGVAAVNLGSKDAVDKFGDEPMLLKSKHKETPIYLSANRYKAGEKLLSENENIKIVICDDGFQHFALKRDCNIVLIDCTECIAAYQMLPLGRLREPLNGLSRADFIIFTKANWATKKQLTESKKLVNKYFKLTDGNYAVAEYKSSFPELDKNNVLLVSSIANPESFETNIKKYGQYNVKRHLTFKDHHCYSKKDIDNIIQEFNYNKCNWILTTEKDMVKLINFDKIKLKIKTVNISVHLTSGKESFEHELFKNFN